MKIVRDNMPFGSVGAGEYGTYFIGYSRAPAVTELMLRNMFIGRREGNYDRILDVSRAVTGCLFFVPPAPLLESLGDEGRRRRRGQTDDAADQSPPAGSGSRSTGSLNIGSLRGESQYE